MKSPIYSPPDVHALYCRLFFVGKRGIIVTRRMEQTFYALRGGAIWHDR